jgi:hypothetical protein
MINPTRRPIRGTAAPRIADYISRLASLEKLHAQHFGQQLEAPKEPAK